MRFMAFFSTFFNKINVLMAFGVFMLSLTHSQRQKHGRLY
jgi:hypothetical protein